MPRALIVKLAILAPLALGLPSLGPSALGISAARAAGFAEPPLGSALPKAPYTIKCFQDRDLVVVEDLSAKPIWRDGEWQARSWSADPRQGGLEIVIRPGANGTCIVKQNAR